MNHLPLIILAGVNIAGALTSGSTNAPSRSYWPPLQDSQSTPSASLTGPPVPPTPTEAVVASVKDAFLAAPRKNYWPPAASFVASTFGNTFWPPPKWGAASLPPSTTTSTWTPHRQEGGVSSDSEYFLGVNFALAEGDSNHQHSQLSHAADVSWAQDGAIVACVAAALASKTYWPPLAAGPQQEHPATISEVEVAPDSAFGLDIAEFAECTSLEVTSQQAVVNCDGIGAVEDVSIQNDPEMTRVLQLSLYHGSNYGQLDSSSRALTDEARMEEELRELEVPQAVFLSLPQSPLHKVSVLTYLIVTCGPYFSIQYAASSAPPYISLIS